MSVRGKSKVHNEMGFALMAVNIRKYTAINTENGTFSPEDGKNACAYLFMINTSIFIYPRLVLSQPRSFISDVFVTIKFLILLNVAQVLLMIVGTCYQIHLISLKN